MFEMLFYELSMMPTMKKSLVMKLNIYEKQLKKNMECAEQHN